MGWRHQRAIAADSMTPHVKNEGPPSRVIGRRSSLSASVALLVLVILCGQHGSMWWPCDGLGARRECLVPAFCLSGTAAPAPVDPSRFAQHHPWPGRSQPRPIRILPEYQLPADIAPETALLIRKVVDAAVLTLQGYVQVRTPIGEEGLLAVPDWLSSATCKFVSPVGFFISAKTCSEGLSPSFDEDLPESNVRAPMCGPARINPAHVLSSSWPCFYDDHIADTTCQKNAAGTIGGVVTDLVVYITAAECDGSIAAYAMPCMQDPSNSRPVIGMLNVCDAGVDAEAPDKMLAIVIHELLHVLGMSDVIFSEFINGSTSQPLGVENVVMFVPPSPDPAIRSNYQIVIKPTVVRETAHARSVPRRPATICRRTRAS
ncbi:hypothetical protein FOA52_002014 [Chlamydomonas sp. UWO 241]|nr:hypothetical protein FOA52_002014 [Chlamydomonas sp. UWO 241]